MSTSARPHRPPAASLLHGQLRQYLADFRKLARLGRSLAARLSWIEAVTIFEDLHAPRAAQIRARIS